MSKKIIFFSPHSSVWEHSFSEALIAESLQKSGHKVTMIGCKGILSERCTTYDAKGINYEAKKEDLKKICKTCIKYQEFISKKFSLKRLYLENYVLKEDINRVRWLEKKVEDLDYVDIKFESLNIGLYSLYELLVNLKINCLLLTKYQKLIYKKYLRGSLLSVIGVGKIIQKEHPDAIVTYNSLYSNNRSIAEYSRSKGIKDVTLHAGNNFSNRLSRIILSRETTIDHEKYLLQLWDKYSMYPASKKIIETIADHLLTMIDAKIIFNYGVAPDFKKNIRDIYKIKENDTILLATMSSGDERFAAEVVGLGWDSKNLLFKTQIDWVNWLINYVRYNPNYFLIIRVHPRELPNRRDKKISAQASELKKLFNNLPPNVVINWPDDDLSIYDLMREVNVLLNYHSSAGREFAMVGLPVVIYSKNVSSFPTDFCLLGDTEDEYILKIHKAVENQFDFSRIIKVYRWLALDHYYSVLNINNKNLLKSNQSSFARNFMGQLISLFSVIKLEHMLDVWNRSKLLNSKKYLNDFFTNDIRSIADISEIIISSEAEECAALKQQLLRVANSIGALQDSNCNLYKLLKIAKILKNP